MSGTLRDESTSEPSINNDEIKDFRTKRTQTLTEINKIFHRSPIDDMIPAFTPVKMAWSEEDCQNIITTFQEHGHYIPGQINMPNKERRHSERRNIRSVGVWQLDEESLHKHIMHIFNEVNDKVYGYDLWDIEIPQLCVYYDKDAGHYSWHQDLTPYPYELDQDKMCRKLSMSILLNDSSEFEGGEMQCFYGIHSNGEPAFVTAPLHKPGDGVIFDSTMFHRVKRVTRGTRAALVIWCWGKR